MTAPKSAAMRRFWGRARAFPVSSTKGAHGHAIGATGALELLAVILALRDGILPPTVGCRQVAEDCGLDIITGRRTSGHGGCRPEQFLCLWRLERGAGAACGLGPGPALRGRDVRAITISFLPEAGAAAAAAAAAAASASLLAAVTASNPGREALQRCGQHHFLIRRHEGHDRQRRRPAFLNCVTSSAVKPMRATQPTLAQKVKG